MKLNNKKQAEDIILKRGDYLDVIMFSFGRCLYRDIRLSGLDDVYYSGGELCASSSKRGRLGGYNFHNIVAARDPRTGEYVHYISKEQLQEFITMMNPQIQFKKDGKVKTND